MGIPDITLHDGLTFPVITFGTYKLNGVAGMEAMVSALDVGYHALDSAFNYENEGAVGHAVRKSGKKREELRIASKLPGRHHDYNEALATIEESLYRAQLDYYDLYYIHWPNPKVGKYVEAWQALIEAKNGGMYAPLPYATSCLSIWKKSRRKQGFCHLSTRLSFPPTSRRMICGRCTKN